MDRLDDIFYKAIEYSPEEYYRLKDVYNLIKIKLFYHPNDQNIIDDALNFFNKFIKL